MRELTKSMLSYTWGVSMFGVQQIANLLMPGNEKPMSKATASFDQVTTATVDQLGTTALSAFRMCDQLQRVMVDMMLGGIFLVMTMVGASLMKNPPAGYQPKHLRHKSASGVEVSEYQFTPGEVLRTPAFYLLWLGFGLGSSAGLLIISQLVPFARSQGIPGVALATMTLAVGAIGNVSGRILSGWLSDTLGRLNTLRVVLAISTVAIPVMYWVGAHVFAVYVMVFIVYFCYGAQAPVNPATCADFWGTKNVGTNYGLLFTAWGTAGVIGPTIGGVLFDKYRNYEAAFYAAAILAAIAFVCEMFARRPHAPGAASPRELN